MKRFASIALLVLVPLGVVSRSAYGTPMLRLTDGVTTINVTDQGVGDANSAVGAITFVGSISPTSKWVFNVTTGVTKPVSGTAASPHMDVSTLNMTSMGPGTLTVQFTETGFGPLAANNSFRADIGGTTTSNGAIIYKTYLDSGNVGFAQTTLLTSQSFVGTPFSGTALSGAVSPANPYSLTEVLTITHTGAGQTSLDAELQAVPEPSALLLLGSGLAGFGYLRMRRRTSVR